MVKGKQKFALWLTPETKQQIEKHYREDNCRSQSEYIEKAIRFYSGYRDVESADEYLPRVLSDVLEGKLGAMGKRMGHLLFKLAVEQDLFANIASAVWEVDLDTVEKLRARCVRNVQRTNGEVKLEDAVRYQRSPE